MHGMIKFGLKQPPGLSAMGGGAEDKDSMSTKPQYSIPPTWTRRLLASLGRVHIVYARSQSATMYYCS